MMIKRLTTVLLAAAIVGISMFGFMPTAHADFNHNLIMDDYTFSNTGTMSAAAINNFLNQFPSSCISPNNGFSSPDPTGYSPSTGYTYGGNVTGGQVIYDAALAYGINPQVLIATLQKESSVVSGDASYHCTYINTAMGYGCPDSGSCPTNPATMSGFSKQLIHAAWLLRFGEQRSLGNTGWNVQANNFPQGGDHWDNSDDPPTCYGGPMTQGNLSRGCGQAVTFYDGYTTIDGQSVHMDSGATAALYWYTPHFSGNQSFTTIFTGWFGPTTSNGISLGRDAGSPVALAFNQNGSLDLLGIADNDSIYQKSQSSPSSSTWGAWSPIPGALRNIAGETSSNGRIQLVGVASNGNVYYSSQASGNSTDWAAWSQMDGALATAAVARNYDGSIEVVGVAANGSIYQKRQNAPDSTDWGSWTQIPGALNSIAADTNADGRIQVVGVASNGSIYTTSETAPNSTDWSPWTPVDGGLATAAIARNQDGTLGILGTAANGAIYYKSQTAANSNTWGSWTQIPGALNSIAAESNNDGRLQLVGVAGNGSIYYTSQTTINSNTWNAWAQMDGALRKY